MQNSEVVLVKIDYFRQGIELAVVNSLSLGNDGRFESFTEDEKKLIREDWQDILETGKQHNISIPQITEMVRRNFSRYPLSRVLLFAGSQFIFLPMSEV